MRHAAVGILVLAAALRALRAMVRWEEWSLHYASYNLPTASALRSGHWAEALSTWAGLHPPLYPLLHATIEALWPAPALWFALSVSASVLAVVLVLRANPGILLPALLLATDPVQLHYAAEVNNYPLATAWIALGWWAIARGRMGWLIIAGIGAGWTHLLAAVVVLCMALTQKRAAVAIGGIALGLLPLAPEAWSLATDPGTLRQPSLILGESVADAWSRFGITPLLFLPLLIRGLREQHTAAAAWLGGVTFWICMVAFDIAAPHQFPYATVLGIPAALLIAAGLPSARFTPWLVGIVIARSLWFGGQDVARLASLIQDQGEFRGIDAALEASLPGDAIVLVRGPGQPDDDRRHVSGTMWRLSPFSPAPAVPMRFRPDTVGQPRIFSGRVVYTFSDGKDFIGEIPEERVFTVAYDGAEQDLTRIPVHPRQGQWHTAGPDRWRGPVNLTGDP